MKKILTFASVLVLAANVAFAANQPYEPNPGGNDGPTDEPTQVELSGNSGRSSSENDQGGTEVDPRTEDPTWVVAVSRALEMIGLVR